MESIPDKATSILVVDDDQGLLLSIKATVLSAGLPEPALVSDSRRVIDLVQANDFKVILLDLVIDNVDPTAEIDEGEVLAVLGSDLKQKLRIKFERAGVKTVMVRYANLELA